MAAIEACADRPRHIGCLDARPQQDERRVAELFDQAPPASSAEPVG